VRPKSKPFNRILESVYLIRLEDFPYKRDHPSHKNNVVFPGNNLVSHSIASSSVFKQPIVIGFISLVLTACGGGGGSTSTPTPTPTPADTTKPVISITGEQALTIGFGELYSEQGATATDNVDGSVTVSIAGSVNNNVNGDYELTYTASDAAGNTATATRVITVFTGNSSPESYAGYNLLWSDEFSGAALDNTKWGYDIGGDGWGNNELQYHRTENASVDGGFLIIEARKENFGGRSYTSSRINTKDKFSFKYGRMDIRAALPEGQGLWPALWMLGQNFSTVSWPYCGEIDIMEMIGGNGLENRTLGTAHWNNGGVYESNGTTKKPYAPVSYGGNYSLSGTETLANAFHIFGLTWTPDSITWYIDSVQYHTMAIDSSASLSAFQKDFFLIFNVAVGGDWPGSPDANTVFPQRMLVDYVRVFQQN
jgi:beta-glucanase (GH16 family)